MSLTQTKCAAASALATLAAGEEMNALQMLKSKLLPVLLSALPRADLDLQGRLSELLAALLRYVALGLERHREG
jgi:hypothetical protein